MNAIWRWLVERLPIRAFAGSTYAECVAMFERAQVGRNPKGEDTAEWLRRNDEHAVAKPCAHNFSQPDSQP